MSASILGYSTPTLLAWEEDYDTPRGVFGDSYLAKIIRTQEYMETMGNERDNDLLLVVDAYDVWFQLRKETLVARYNKIIKESNERLKQELGEAWNFEGLRNRVVFGAGKRCSPNDPHSIGCYAVPEPPFLDDLYGNSTDMGIRSNKFGTTRPRFLNAGFIMGSVKGLRKLFSDAREEAEKLMIFEDQVPEDDSIHIHGATYHSDQSVWNVLFGQQEYMREVMRLKYKPETDGIGRKIPREGPRGSGRIDGKKVDNIFDPPFEHPNVGNLGADGLLAREYGVALDYASDIVHNTDSAQTDAMWLDYGQPMEEQFNDTRRENHDCAQRVPEEFPQDILDAGPPNQYPPIEWSIQSYYTDICLASVPVMVHHDGDKTARERDWSRMWFYENGKRLFNFAGGGATAGHARSFEAHKAFPRPAGMVNEVGGAWLNNGRFLRWSEVCPKSWEEEIFPSKKPARRSIFKDSYRERG
ncbi:MAG: hypothetical protein M1831_004765 [Alyxoria varia]|nr:MAG: hypothetical protein M1831_004765 [Alyxoria varia]